MDAPPPPKQQLDFNKPCRIVNVNFEGANRTRANLLATIVSDIFGSKSVLEFLQKSVQIKENLNSLNAFSSVEIQVDQVGHNDDNNNNDEQPDQYEVTFSVIEKNRIKSSVYTGVDTHSTHLDVQLALPNISGNGDSIRLSAKHNGKSFYSTECRFSVPVSPWKSLWSPRYDLFYGHSEWSTLSGYNQKDHSIVNQVEFLSQPNLQHVVSFENVWRAIRSSSARIPIEIREQCGHSVKSSLKHILTWDNRVGNNNFPLSGILASLTNEIATSLVTNGARFTRHEFRVQLNTQILPKYDLLCQFNLLGGTLLQPNKFNICDRFFAGGPLLVRGFKSQGIGPNIREFPLGDMSYLSAGAHLYPILPGTSADSLINSVVRPHLFVNAATIGDWRDRVFRIRTGNDLKREALYFRDSMRFSCGFGIVTQIAGLRLELNYCIPLSFKMGDLTSRGLQWGIGMTYT